MDIITRREAKARGLRAFFTGRPCIRGHVSPRSVSTGHCNRCRADAQEARRQADPEAEKQRMRDYIAREGDNWAARSKAWREQNPERVIAKNAAFRAANPDYGVMWNRHQRAREAGAPGTFTLEDLNSLRKRQRNRCNGCGKRRKLGVDHIIPLSRGGTNWPDNIQLLCHSCNGRKERKTMEEWLRVR